MELGMLALVNGVQRSLDGHLSPRAFQGQPPPPPGVYVGACAGTEATSPVLGGFRGAEG